MSATLHIAASHVCSILKSRIILQFINLEFPVTVNESNFRNFAPIYIILQLELAAVMRFVLDMKIVYRLW